MDSISAIFYDPIIAAANATESAQSPSFLSSGVVPCATPDTDSGLCGPDGREAL